MAEKLSKLIGRGEQIVEHCFTIPRIWRSRGAVGLPQSIFHKRFREKRFGPTFTRLGSVKEIYFNPDELSRRPFQILAPLAVLAAVHGNINLADEVLEQMYGVLYHENGLSKDPGEKIGAGTRSMITGYQQWLQLVARTPDFYDSENLFSNSNTIALLLGNSTSPLKENAWKLAQKKELRHKAVSIPLGIMVGIATGLITKEMMVDPNTLAKIGMVFGSALLGGRDGELIVAKLNKKDKRAFTVLFRLFGAIGSAVGSGLEPQVFSYLVGGNIGVAAYVLFKKITDALCMSPKKIYNEREAPALIKEWVGEHNAGGEKIQPGLIEQLGQPVRHLFAPLLGAIDRQWLLAKNPQGRSQHMPDLNKFGLSGAKKDLTKVRYCDFYSDETQEDLRKLLSSKEGKIISPSEVLRLVAGLEWQRAILRNEPDIAESNFIPSPESLLEFVHQRCASRLNVLKTLPRSEASLRLALSVPTVFRFLRPEYAEPKIGSLAYFRDATFFGGKGANAGNKGVFFPALRLYWSSLFETIKDNAYLHQFFVEVEDLDKSNPQGALAQLRSTFNEIITQQLVPEALTCGLTFALDLDPDSDPSGMVKEQLKALARIPLEEAENKSALQESLMLCTSTLSVLSFYTKVLNAYQSYYVDNAPDTQKPEVKKIFEQAKANMKNIQREIVKAITNHFLVTDPARLVRKTKEGEIETSKEFTYFMYMLALENPEWLKEAALEIERLYKASAQMETGELKSIHSIYALYFINGFTSADSGSSSAQNRYGLPADKLKEVNQAVNSHLSNLAADIISSNLGSGVSAVSVERITDDYLQECNSAVQICAGVITKENFGKLLEACKNNLEHIRRSPSAHATESYKTKKAWVLVHTSQSLVLIRERKFPNDTDLLTLSDDIQNLITECNKLLSAAEVARKAQEHIIAVV